MTIAQNCQQARVPQGVHQFSGPPSAKERLVAPQSLPGGLGRFAPQRHLPGRSLSPVSRVQAQVLRPGQNGATRRPRSPSSFFLFMRKTRRFFSSFGKSVLGNGKIEVIQRFFLGFVLAPFLHHHVFVSATRDEKITFPRAWEGERCGVGIKALAADPSLYQINSHKTLFLQ